MIDELNPARAPTIYYCWQYEACIPHPSNKHVRYRGWFMVATLCEGGPAHGMAMDWAMQQPSMRAVTSSFTSPSTKASQKALNKYFPQPNKNPLHQRPN